VQAFLAIQALFLIFPLSIASTALAYTFLYASSHFFLAVCSALVSTTVRFIIPAFLASTLAASFAWAVLSGIYVVARWILSVSGSIKVGINNGQGREEDEVKTGDGDYNGSQVVRAREEDDGTELRGLLHDPLDSTSGRPGGEEEDVELAEASVIEEQPPRQALPYHGDHRRRGGHHTRKRRREYRSQSGCIIQ
jgi:hypothetical protein